MEYRLKVCQQICYLFQNPSNIITEAADAKVKIGVSESDDKKILLIIADVNLVAKEFQQHEYCHKKQPSLPSKLDYSSWLLVLGIWLWSERQELPEIF